MNVSIDGKYDIELPKRYIHGFRRDFIQADINEMINWGKANIIKIMFLCSRSITSNIDNNNKSWNDVK